MAASSGDDNELLIDAGVAERDRASDPDALAFGGGDLVADALPDDLALELGKGQQHVERETAHAAGRIEMLGDRDERHGMLVEKLDQLGEVGERPGQAVDFIYDDDVDLPDPDVRQKLLQGRAIERSAGERAVIIVVVDQPPALMRLAFDVGLAGLTLGIEAN